MNGCLGCLKPGKDGYCTACRKRLFDGRKVPDVLPFSRPEYNATKRTITPDRLSISGIQTKISLAFQDGKLTMVETGGQYILKPIPPGELLHLGLMPVNEHLTMQIARQVFGIDVAENALIRFNDGEIAFLVRRFDVQSDGTKRLQEDFAQIANRSEETHGKNYKYDFSYEAIARLIRRHVGAYVVDLERYFTLVVFNYLINNGDAHVKNFSLLRSEETGEYRLAPAYDLLNTRLHLPNESRTALELFECEYETPSFQKNGFYAYDDFTELASRLGLVKTRYQRILKRFIDQTDDIHALIDRSLLTAECKQLYKAHIQDTVAAISYSYQNEGEP